jgi:hypothetical protein
MREMQLDPAFRKYVDGAAYKSNKPMSDPFSGEWLAHNEALLKVGDPNRVNGMEVLTEVVRQFEASGAVRDCSARFDDKGELDVQLTLDEEGAIDVVTGGPLAPHRAGQCVQERLRAVAAAASVRRPVRSAVLNHKFVL